MNSETIAKIRREETSGDNMDIKRIQYMRRYSLFVKCKKNLDRVSAFRIVEMQTESDLLGLARRIKREL